MGRSNKAKMKQGNYAGFLLVYARSGRSFFATAQRFQV